MLLEALRAEISRRTPGTNPEKTIEDISGKLQKEFQKHRYVEFPKDIRKQFSKEFQ